MTVAIQVFEVERPKSRSRVWAFRVVDETRVVFDSAWVSIQFADGSAAEWLAERVRSAHLSGALVLPSGHGDTATGIVWSGTDDDCIATHNGLHLHVEHVAGAITRGGRWWCAAGEGFNLADHPGIHLRSAAAGRWLCELLACSPRAAVDVRT
jgi:hypothetical protein